MKTIGLTGSIGMGKSATADIFADLGVPVFDSDAAVHNLIGPGGIAVNEIEHAFPGVKASSEIDRKKLGERVFSDTEALERLEKILHPMVIKKREDFVQSQDADLVLFDIPLLFEKGYQDDVDFVVVVTAPYEIQKKRVLSRDGMTTKKFENIIQKQMPDAEKRKKADFILHTDQGFDYARDQAEIILKQIREN